MRDWSSDVCSSDLYAFVPRGRTRSLSGRDGADPDRRSGVYVIRGAVDPDARGKGTFGFRFGTVQNAAGCRLSEELIRSAAGNAFGRAPNLLALGAPQR